MGMLILMTVLALFVGISFYIGRYRFMVLCLLILFLPQMSTGRLESDSAYIVWWIYVYVILLVCLSYRTFFIHGVSRTQNKRSDIASVILYPLSVYLYGGAAIIHGGWYIFHLIYNQAWHEIASVPMMLIIITLCWTVVGGVSYFAFSYLINHFIIRRKFVVVLDKEVQLNNVLLFGFRYRKRKKSGLAFYAYESISGVTYYMRKAKQKDKTIVYHTRLIDYIDDKVTSQKKETKLNKDYYMRSFWITLILAISLFSYFAYETPIVKTYMNENVFARDYIKTRGKAVSCSKVDKVRSGKSGFVSEFSCEMAYAQTKKIFYFQRNDEKSAEQLKSAVMKTGLYIYYNPNNENASYVNIDRMVRLEILFMSILMFTLSLYSIFCAYRMKRNRQNEIIKEQKRLLQAKQKSILRTQKQKRRDELYKKRTH